MFQREIFSARFADLKRIRGVQSKDIAEAIGVSRPAISQFTKCSSTPSADTLIALADYFNVSLDYLVGRSDDPCRK